MYRAALSRVLLAGVIAVTPAAFSDVRAQTVNCPIILAGPCAPSSAPANTNSGSHNNNIIWYVVGGVVVAAIGAILATHTFPGFGPPPPEPPPPGYPPPPVQPELTQIPPNQTPPSPPRPGRGPTVQALRRGFDMPPVGEVRFVPDELLLD